MGGLKGLGLGSVVKCIQVAHISQNLYLRRHLFGTNLNHTLSIMWGPYLV